MGRVRVRVNYDDRELRLNIRGYEAKIKEMLELIVDYHAAQGQAEMKMNAPWTDRTGAARNGLFTIVEKEGDGHYTIIFSHTMHYGFWLEVKFSGRDAIIMPTVISQGYALMDDIEKRL